ncbi:translation initiation factor IF-2-like [Falco rusticolus]|uniref:translation initiation factor IF-2-like n=1 Tax=Falco rusticolus TaxID=120794 RepID=UPI0018869FBD|nr:translation initiation factor IF-2-like [Falco rusticolus]
MHSVRAASRSTESCTPLAYRKFSCEFAIRTGTSPGCLGELGSNRESINPLRESAPPVPGRRIRKAPASPGALLSLSLAKTPERRPIPAAGSGRRAPCAPRSNLRVRAGPGRAGRGGGGGGRRRSEPLGSRGAAALPPHPCPRPAAASASDSPASLPRSSRNRLGHGENVKVRAGDRGLKAKKLTEVRKLAAGSGRRSGSPGLFGRRPRRYSGLRGERGSLADTSQGTGFGGRKRCRSRPAAPRPPAPGPPRPEDGRMDGSASPASSDLGNNYIGIGSDPAKSVTKRHLV